jgi:putative endonuclease
MRTLRQQRGVLAEDIAAAHVAQIGWQVVGRNVRVGRDEIDILAIDPGPPVELVCIEVRSARSVAFGAPEERVDRPKVGRLYRSMANLRVGIAAQRRVDLIVVDRRRGGRAVRHLRRLEPP